MARIKKKKGDKGARSFVIWMTVVGIALIGSYVAFIEWKSRPPKHLHQAKVEAEAKEVKDPICGMMVKPPAGGHVEYRAKHYYFCSITCKEFFEKEPEKYLHRKDAKNAKKMDMKEMK